MRIARSVFSYSPYFFPDSSSIRRMIGANSSVSYGEANRFLSQPSLSNSSTVATRSRPDPVSMFFEGSGVRFSPSQLYDMNTRFQISRNRPHSCDGSQAGPQPNCSPKS